MISVNLIICWVSHCDRGHVCDGWNCSSTHCAVW